MIQNSEHDGTTVVSVDGLTRRFGKVTALDGVSLAVPRGVVFGLVGVNGAGKTTLLKHVLGRPCYAGDRGGVFGAAG